LPAFANLAKFRRNRFNFTAFLFSGGWMLYRKQYKIGSIITAIITALYLLMTYVSVNFTAPLLSSLLQQIGVNINTASPTPAQTVQVTELLMQKSAEQILLFFVPSIIMLILFAIMLIVGFNGNKWYLKNSIDKIKQIQEQAPDTAGAAIQLQEQGGVNAALAICLLVCYLIVTYLPSLL